MLHFQECLDEGVDVDAQDEHGNTLVHIAAQQGLKKMCKFLLRRGAEINAVNLQGNTILHYAFYYGFEELGQYLITKGADDSLTNKDGLTCFEGLSSEDLAKL